MNLAALLLNTLKEETKMWNFSGDFSNDEKEQFNLLMSQYEPIAKPGGGWNYWVISKYSSCSNTFHLTRFAWEYGWNGTFDELKEKMKQYQER